MPRKRGRRLTTKKKKQYNYSKLSGVGKECTTYVYMLTIDGKPYIGWTSQEPKERWKQHLKTAASGDLDRMQKVHHAIAKHGIDRKRTIGKYPNELQGLIAEAQAIQRFDAINNGWNSSPIAYGATMDVSFENDRLKVTYRRLK